MAAQSFLFNILSQPGIGAALAEERKSAHHLAPAQRPRAITVGEHADFIADVGDILRAYLALPPGGRGGAHIRTMLMDTLVVQALFTFFQSTMC